MLLELNGESQEDRSFPAIVDLDVMDREFAEDLCRAAPVAAEVQARDATFEAARLSVETVHEGQAGQVRMYFQLPRVAAVRVAHEHGVHGVAVPTACYHRERAGAGREVERTLLKEGAAGRFRGGKR